MKQTKIDPFLAKRKKKPKGHPLRCLIINLNLAHQIFDFPLKYLFLCQSCISINYTTIQNPGVILNTSISLTPHIQSNIRVCLFSLQWTSVEVITSTFSLPFLYLKLPLTLSGVLFLLVFLFFFLCFLTPFLAPILPSGAEI